MTRSLAPEHVIGHALRLPDNSAGRPGSPELERSVMRLTSPPVPVFTLERVRFDEDYRPLDNTRITTNFANLARGENRKENLRNAIRMIDNRFNELAASDNETADHYSVDLDIVSVSVDLDEGGDGERFPIIEVLETTIVDHRTGSRIPGIAGNNFSSYVRDYDFSVVLPAHNAAGSGFSVPDDFGVLHGNLFRSFVASDAYTRHFAKAPVICLSVSSTKTYQRTDTRHPVLGVEYRQDEYSLTDDYFAKMGMKVRYFMPPRGAAPLAFYHVGDLLTDYSDLELAATIATMESFQKIYRPEIYNANSSAPARFQPSLSQPDYSLTRIEYDREERSRLAVEQGRFAQEHFIEPHRESLELWSAQFSARELEEARA